MLLQVAELVDTLRQAITGKGVNGVIDAAAVRQEEPRCLDIDTQFDAGMRDQPVMSIDINNNWQQPVF